MKFHPGKIFEIRDKIKDSLGSFNWDMITESEYILRLLIGLGSSVVIMFIAHLIGSNISTRIDRHVRKSAEENLERAMKDGEDISSNDVSFDSRNALATLGGRIMHIFILFVGFLIVLRVMGIQIATILAALSTLAIFIGLAIQGTLGDMASGILLALFQTYEVGDIIRIDDRDGRVIDFRLVNTLVQDMHSLTLVTIPNRVIQDSIIVNYSRSHYHMFSFTVRISNKIESFDWIDTLKEHLRDEEEYPEIFRNPNLDVFVGVHDISEPATIVRINVPMRPTKDLEHKRLSVRTKVRKRLAELNVKMWPSR